MITKASSVGICVSDQDRGLAFYRDKLGFDVLQDTPMGEMGWWAQFKDPDGNEFGLGQSGS